MVSQLTYSDIIDKLLKKEFYQNHKNILSDSILHNYSQAFKIEFTR